MNPFSYGTVVKGNNFYDRKTECGRIVDTLAGGNNLVLYAPRRFGKTSLVFKAIEQLEKQGFICIYFDLMPVFSPESFARLYAKSLSEKQNNMQKFGQLFASAVKNIRPILGFGDDGKPEFSIDFAGTKVDETTLSQLLALPEKLTKKNKRAIVFFDEFQEVEKLRKVNFEQLLRSKIQQQSNVNYMFLGSKTHLLRAMFNNKSRAFYNSASQMTISYLPENDTIKYLKQNFAAHNIKIDKQTAKYLIEQAANIPHYIQLLAAEIWQYAINDIEIITKHIINECVRRAVVQNSDYYAELFDRQSESKKQLLQALIYSGKNIFSVDYAQKFNLPSVGTLQRAVKGLTNDGIIERMKNNYFIGDPFFALFIVKMTKKQQ